MSQKALVLDANILLRAVFGQRVRSLIITHVDRVAFLTPEACVAEVERHLPSLLERRNLDKTLVEIVWKLLLEHIQVVPSALYEQREAEAKQRISIRDPDDWPVVALALMLECPVWTEDQDFFGSGIATWTTDRVSLYLVS